MALLVELCGVRYGYSHPCRCCQVTVRAGQTTLVELPRYLQASGTARERKGVYLEASDDISVLGFRREASSCGAFQVRGGGRVDEWTRREGVDVGGAAPSRYYNVFLGRHRAVSRCDLYRIAVQHILLRRVLFSFWMSYCLWK